MDFGIPHQACLNGSQVRMAKRRVCGRKNNPIIQELDPAVMERKEACHPEALEGSFSHFIITVAHLFKQIRGLSLYAV